MAAAGQKLVSLHVSVPRRSKNGRGMTERNKMANMSAAERSKKVVYERWHEENRTFNLQTYQARRRKRSRKNAPKPTANANPARVGDMA